MSKFQNLAKLRKKLSKSVNLINFDTIKARAKFLTLNAKKTFNRLWLGLIKALILQRFDPECHIWIETHVLGYAMVGMLSQLTSKTNPNGIIIKTDLS